MAEAAGVRARGWGWRHATRRDFAIRGLDLDIEPGEHVMLLGASGAGKSTLMAGMAGLLGGSEEGEQAGELTIDGLEPAKARGRVGLVLQDPDSQVILERVGDDAAFGCENLGVPREEIWARVRSSLDLVGLGDLDLDRSTRHLSGGQRQRLALAGVLAMRPGLLLLDEPTANLDPEGVREVHDAVAQVLERTGQTMVVVEHHIDVWLDLIDRVVVIGPASGDTHVSAVLADGAPDEVFRSMGGRLAAGGAWVPGRVIPDFARKGSGDAAASRDGARETMRNASPAVLESGGDLCAPRSADGPALFCEGLSFGRSKALGSHLDLGFMPGEVTALMGPNGAGKSTLALTLAGLLEPLDGHVRVAPWIAQGVHGDEPNRWKSRELLGRVGMVFQEPEHQFAASRVVDEVAIGPKSMGKSAEEAQEIARTMLERMNLSRFAEANPYTLSGGEKRRLSVASMLAASPRIVIMDEPTFGQDFTTWTEMVRLIAGVRDQGVAVIVVTHDDALVDALGARRLVFDFAKEDAA